MADIRIDSQGFSISHWQFPPFTLRGGECVTLRFPQVAVATAEQDQIVACLAGMESVPGLKIQAKVVVANPACGPSGWRQWFEDPTSFAWL